jgi:hypothetical protein
MNTGRAFAIEALPRAMHRIVRLMASRVKGGSASGPSGVVDRHRRAVGHAPRWAIEPYDPLGPGLTSPGPHVIPGDEAP